MHKNGVLIKQYSCDNKRAFILYKHFKQRQNLTNGEKNLEIKILCHKSYYSFFLTCAYHYFYS